MNRFDFSKIKDKAKELFSSEVKVSKSIQDEIKIYNERFPKWLEPLHKINMNNGESEGNIGEFSESEISGDSYEEQAWSFFVGKGFTKKCTAGIMGNLQQESGINPTVIQGGGRGPGTGLVQWGDSMDGGRWNSLERWAKSEGKDKWDMHTQLNYLWIEMTNGSHDSYWRRAGSAIGVDLSGSKEVPVKKFGAINNIEKAMIAFELTIERAGKKHNQTRLKYANNFYEKYKDWSPGASGTSSGSFQKPHRNANYTVTSPFGYRIHPIKKTKKLHSGIDVSSGKHTPLYTVAAGKVVQSTFMAGGWGNYVVVNHGVIGKKEVFSLYAHMNKPSILKIGQTISGSTQVGIEGTTGSSTGIHLHLEIREGTPGQSWSSGKPVDPKNYINF